MISPLSETLCPPALFDILTARQINNGYFERMWITLIDDVSNKINHFFALSCQSIEHCGAFQGLPSQGAISLTCFFSVYFCQLNGIVA